MSKAIPTLIEAQGTTPLQERGSYRTEVGEAYVAQYLSSDKSSSASLGSSTPFYKLASDAEIHNPRIAALRDSAHKLVGSGLVSDAELKDFSVRLQNTSTPTPAENLSKENSYAHSWDAINKITVLEFIGVETPKESFNDGKLINLEERQVNTMLKGMADPVLMSFLHEMGHATRSHSSQQLLSEIRQSVALNSELEGTTASRLGSSIDKVLTEAESKGAASEKWQVAVNESQADVFAIVALQAIAGKEHALAELDKLVVVRDHESTKLLTENFSKAGFMEGHHTTESLLVLREKIESGAVAQAISNGDAQKLIAATVAEGLTREYENVALAKLNPHTLKDGELRPGLPEGVTAQDVAGTDLTKFREAGGGAAIFVESKDASRIAEGNLQLQIFSAMTGEVASLKDAGLENLSGKGYSVLAVPEGVQNVDVTDVRTKAETSQQLQPAVNVLLSTYGYIKAEETAAQRQDPNQGQKEVSRSAEREL